MHFIGNKYIFIACKIQYFKSINHFLSLFSSNQFLTNYFRCSLCTKRHRNNVTLNGKHCNKFSLSSKNFGISGEFLKEFLNISHRSFQIRTTKTKFDFSWISDDTFGPTRSDFAAIYRKRRRSPAAAGWRHSALAQ